MPPTTLDRPSHDEDFHAWAMDQAERLRALALSRSNEPIDWDLVAEEIEDMGRSERHGCESFLEQIIAHLLKIEHARDPAAIPHWTQEIGAFRIGLERKLTPSIAQHLRTTLPQRFERARKIAINAQALSEPDLQDRLPRRCHYGFEQITGDWLPERARTA